MGFPQLTGSTPKCRFYHFGNAAPSDFLLETGSGGDFRCACCRLAYAR
jgi:hypothetical protein